MSAPPSLLRRIVVVIWSGVAAYFIALVLQGVWSALVASNLALSPAVPWSVPVIAILVWLAWQYLGGKGPPHSSSQERRRHLRANAVPDPIFFRAVLAGVLAIIALAGCWIVMTSIVRMPGNVLPDVSKYPRLTTTLMIVTGSLIGPVMEQAGFWGYGQVMLEGAFPAPASIVILSVLFSVGPHPPAGAAIWPKLVFYFFSSVVFGTMVFLTNSILPSLVVHILGDLSFFTFVWPRDPIRPLIGESGMDLWFWLHFAQTIVFAALAFLVFKRLGQNCKT
jgi:membrane protease YdiL (CAAX protease family)